MTRDQFTSELLQRLRNIRQKEERVRVAYETLRVYGDHPSRTAALAEALTNLEAAEIQFAEFVWGVLEERAALEPVS